MHSNKSRYDRIWGFCASLFLHAVPILIFGSISKLDLSIGPDARLDFVWLTPSSAFSAAPPAAADMPTPVASQKASAPSQELQSETAELDAAPASSDPDPAMVEPPAVRLPPETGRKEPAATPAVAVSSPEKETAAPAQPKPTAEAHPAQPPKKPDPKKESMYLGRQTKTAAVSTADHEPPLLQEEVGAGDTPMPPQQSSQLFGTEKRRKTRERPTTPEAKAQRVAEPGHQHPASAKEALRPARENLEPKPLAVPQKPQAAGSTAAFAQPTLLAPRQEARQAAGKLPAALSAGKSSAMGRPSRLLTPPPLTQAKETPAAKEIAKPKAEKPLESRGLVVTSIQGDLKMVIAGDSSVKLHVAFREYPKARRNKVQTRSESRREQKIEPIFAKTRQETREAVIEKALEGIYLFSAESERAEPAKATFVLKIFETGARAKVITIGTRTVSNKAAVTKVLMPEGIVWEDDSAFTGSLEDSESTTKFNAQTGLYWKEYNE